MQTIKPSAYTPPRLGRGPAAEGRRAALRSFHSDLTTMDGDAAADLDRVLAGNAPAEFKDAYTATLHALSALFDTTGR